MFWSDGDDYSEDSFIEIDERIIHRDRDMEFFIHLGIDDVLNSELKSHFLAFQTKIDENGFHEILTNQIPRIAANFLFANNSNEAMTDKKMVELFIEQLNDFNTPSLFSCVLSDNSDSDADYNLYPEFLNENSDLILPISFNYGSGYVHKLTLKKHYFKEDSQTLYFLSDQPNWNKDKSVFDEIKSDMFLSEVSKILSNRGYTELSYNSIKISINSNGFSDFWKEFLDDDIYQKLLGIE